MTPSSAFRKKHSAGDRLEPGRDRLVGTRCQGAARACGAAHTGIEVFLSIFSRWSRVFHMVFFHLMLRVDNVSLGYFGKEAFFFFPHKKESEWKIYGFDLIKA